MAWHLVRFAGKEAIHWGRLVSSPPSTPEESVEVEVLEPCSLTKAKRCPDWPLWEKAISEELATLKTAGT